ncbi:MAG TPA: hypothetical protein VK752_14195 [Bryobacteraceae bacterium]|nr:hypothetical protein [Bryobacteraceae bacterium]
MQDTLVSSGFTKFVSQDVTKQGIQALRHVARGAASPGFGIGTLIGPEFPLMAANLVANLESGACALIQAVFAK